MKIHLESFTCGPFQENGYILYTDTKDAVIIDPGCSNSSEKELFKNFIATRGLNVHALLSTHCHIDHVFGNPFILETYKVPYYIHELDLPVLNAAERSAAVYGIPGFEVSPLPTNYLQDQELLTFGGIELKVLFGPGHAPGHVAFYSVENDFVVSGDILFKGSFGRVDLPGGDIETLKHTIHQVMFQLPEQTRVHSGHGPVTTIGEEKKTNYILQF